MAFWRAAWWPPHRCAQGSFAPVPFKALAVFGVCAALAACQTSKPETPKPEATTKAVPDVPVTQGRYVVGKPYRQNGVWYHPAEDWTYNEVGIASWYGDFHHGRRTANGETFDLRALTAAHPTLPLPTRVRVTNIENGKSIEVRVNDRGPFAGNRLIDLSERAAEMLGFKEKGTARVRVEMLGRAPLEMFRMAKPKHPAPDLPVRAAPSTEVKSAVLPPQEASREESQSKSGETAMAAKAAPDLPEAPADPVGDVIGRVTDDDKTAQADTAGDTANDTPETGEAVPEKTSSTTSGARRLFIQAGAFTVPENAYSLQRLIMKAITGANVSINPAQVGQREFFRVRVGPFTSSEDANGILAQLRNLGQKDAKIISD